MVWGWSTLAHKAPQYRTEASRSGEVGVQRAKGWLSPGHQVPVKSSASSQCDVNLVFQILIKHRAYFKLASSMYRKMYRKPPFVPLGSCTRSGKGLGGGSQSLERALPEMEAGCPEAPGPNQSCWRQKGVQEGTIFQGETKGRPNLQRVGWVRTAGMDSRGGPISQGLGLWDRVSLRR